MLKFLIPSVLLCLSQATFGAAAVCGWYSAELAVTGAKIEIVSRASDYDSTLGKYSTVSTAVSGAASATCTKFFSENDQAVCNYAVKNVVLISDADCWNSAQAVICQKDAEQMLFSVLKIQEKNNKVLVKTLHKSSTIDQTGHRLETYDIQGFLSQPSGYHKIRVPSRINMFVEDDGKCVLMGYSLPTAG